MRDALQRAMEKLSKTSNLSTGLAHPLDESRAKELFIALRDRNVPLSKGAVRQQAEACGWPSPHALKLGELAERIGAGATVRIPFPRGWGRAVVDEVLAATS